MLVPPYEIWVPPRSWETITLEMGQFPVTRGSRMLLQRAVVDSEHDIPCLSLDKLQRTQNAAAWVLSKTRKYDHITPTLIELHWLPVRQRIQFKILLLTWKSLNGLAPSYISQLLTPYVPTQTLRSSDKLLLKIPKTFSSYGDRAFSSCAPKLWNSLPMDIRSCVSINAFKNRLKTYLFQTAYNV